MFERTHGYLLDYQEASRMFVRNAGPNFEDDGLLGWIVGNTEEDTNTLVNLIWYHRKYVMKEEGVPSFDELRFEVVGHGQ